ncbi:MAG: glutaminyl-peptide cyclotransferase [Pseudomonadota bacterium]
MSARRLISGFAVALMIATGAACAQEKAGAIEPVFYDYEIVAQYPHDEGAFTQGLSVVDGVFIETTGQYGESRLRRVEIETGEVLQEVALPNNVFGEGSTRSGDAIIVLTWRNGAGLVFDAETFTPRSTFDYEGEGWGLTHDGERLIMSDGGASLRFFDPDTLEETGRLAVTFRGQPLEKINELEWIDGAIFANVWQSNAIVRIDPETGAVTGVIDLRGLLPDDERRPGRTDVLNGVAWDAERDRLFVTGKYWPKVFEIELKPKASAASD